MFSFVSSNEKQMDYFHFLLYHTLSENRQNSLLNLNNLVKKDDVVRVLPCHRSKVYFPVFLSK